MENWGSNSSITDAFLNSMSTLLQCNQEVDQILLGRQLQGAADATLWSWADRASAAPTGLAYIAPTPSDNRLLPNGVVLTISVYAQSLQATATARFDSSINTKVTNPPRYSAEGCIPQIYYFGSGCKPLTATLVARALMHLWL